MAKLAEKIFLCKEKIQPESADSCSGGRKAASLQALFGLANNEG